jgi:multiple sugar transport system permease protein
VIGARGQLAVLLAPAAAGAVALVALPAVATFVTALYETDLIGPAEPVGLRNFRDLLADPVFYETLRNSLAFVALTVPVRLAAALGLALLLHRPRRHAGAGRTLVYLPTAVPEVATVIAWTFLLNPVFGPVNGVLGALGLPEPEWFASPFPALLGLAIMSWFTIGEGFVIALAARQELPGELYDVARMEGSSPRHTLRRVTLPLMAPVLGLLAARDVALSLQNSFASTYLVTDGGPDRSTLFLPIYIYDVGFEQLRYGYAAAMTVALYVVTALILLAAWRVLRRYSGSPSSS